MVLSQTIFKAYMNFYFTRWQQWRHNIFESGEYNFASKASKNFLSPTTYGSPGGTWNRTLCSFHYCKQWSGM